MGRFQMKINSVSVCLARLSVVVLMASFLVACLPRQQAASVKTTSAMVSLPVEQPVVVLRASRQALKDPADEDRIPWGSIFLTFYNQAGKAAKTKCNGSFTIVCILPEGLKKGKPFVLVEQGGAQSLCGKVSAALITGSPTRLPLDQMMTIESSSVTLSVQYEDKVNQACRFLAPTYALPLVEALPK